MSITNQLQVSSVTPASVSAKPRLPKPDPGSLSFLERARLIVGAAIAAIAWWQGAAPGIAAEPAKKLHLMYLVTAKADDLKPGSVVAVEPAFFTDGKMIVFAYDYCEAFKEDPSQRLTVQEEMLALREKIAEDMRAFESWCMRQDPLLNREWSHDGNDGPSIQFDVKRLAGADHDGTTIRLSSLEIFSYDKAGRGTLASLSGPSVGSPISPEQRKYRFFLLGSDIQLVRRIVPTWRFNTKQAHPLFVQLDAKKEEVKGLTYRLCRDDGSHMPGWCVPKKSSQYADLSIQIVSSFLADVDGDRRPELFAGLRAIVPSVNPSSAPFMWQSMMLVRLGREPWVRADLLSLYEPDVTLHALDRYATTYYLPKLLIDIGRCRYVVTSATTELNTLDVFPLPGSLPSCKYQKSYKFPGLGN